MRLWLHSGGAFREAGEEVADFLGTTRRMLFIPYALHDLGGYVEKVRGLVEPWGFSIDSPHEADDPRQAVASAEAIFMGGGNTFRLLTRLIAMDLLDPIRERVADGLPYLGSSAGSNMACPTIMTTNDMPIVYPPTYEALGLIPFQINAHYMDTDPDSTHKGETREQRLTEYHEMNSLPVLGLREGSLVRREGDELELRGTVGARLFLQGREAEEYMPGDRLDFLLES
jgi:dipeptidase E